MYTVLLSDQWGNLFECCHGESTGHIFKMQTTGARGPTHLVALYVATAGLQDNALGSDEEEITLLVYVLIDVLQNKVNPPTNYRPSAHLT